MPYPRLYRLGLIEAMAISRAGIPSSPAYPRLYRLGLIEAFRADCHSAAAVRYPRLYRLGLIEARPESEA